MRPGGFWAYFLTFLARDGPLEWVRPIPNAPERSWHASGPIFSPNRRFWTHFGPFLMFLARLENQVWAKLGPEPPTPGMPSLGLSRHIFKHFLDMQKICRVSWSTLFFQFPGNARNNLQKKVPEWGPEKSSGICRPGWSLPWPDE